jgi:diguanylate cyclase (GGDEF)-like protein
MAEADEMTARLRADLPGALRDGRVVGYFQPEVELSTGRLVAAELLARWEHPDLGTLSPGLFIPVVEELGLMAELTLLMLRQALGQHRAWAEADQVVPIAVNIGPDRVSDSGFPAAVAKLLREEGVPGRMLTLEVPEKTGTSGETTRFFEQLAELEVRVSLDDYGAGFARLESLSSFPIDELKLSRSIVQPMVSDTAFRAIASTAIDLAHQLGVKVVGEGVESEAVCRELRKIGCGIGQGYFLGRPMQAATFTEWMNDPARRAVQGEASGYPQAGPPASVQPGSGTAGGAAVRAVRVIRHAVRAIGPGTLTAAAAMTVLYGLWQAFRWGGRGDQALIGDLALLPVSGAGAVIAWRVSRRGDLGRRARRAWLLLSAALCLYLAGDVLQFVYEVPLHRRAYPTWSDAVYLSFHVVAFCGLISFPPRRRSAPERWRLLLDMGTVFVGGVVLIWYVTLGPAIGSPGAFNLLYLIVSAYPISDLLLLAGALMVLWRGVPQSSVASLRVIAVGIVAFIAADLTYDYLVAHSGYLGGDPVDTLWFLALTIFYLAAAWQLHATPAGSIVTLPRPAPGRPSFLPYLAVAVSFALLAVAAGRHGVSFDPVGGLLLGTLVLTFMVGGRQYIALLDFSRLATRNQKLAAIDGLTGLYNRRHFIDSAEAAFAHARRASRPFTALMLDVDKFKRINDIHGHGTGDQVLAELAQTCRERLRSKDIVGRYGGDEFIITVPGITSRRAIQIADQLARPPTSVLDRDGKPLAYTVSIGIAESAPDGDLPTLLTRADEAMYEAKQAGGGRWHIFKEASGRDQEESRGIPPASEGALALPLAEADLADVGGDQEWPAQCLTVGPREDGVPAGDHDARRLNVVEDVVRDLVARHGPHLVIVAPDQSVAAGVDGLLGAVRRKAGRPGHPEPAQFLALLAHGAKLGDLESRQCIRERLGEPGPDRGAGDVGQLQGRPRHLAVATEGGGRMVKCLQLGPSVGFDGHAIGSVGGASPGPAKWIVRYPLLMQADSHEGVIEYAFVARHGPANAFLRKMRGDTVLTASTCLRILPGQATGSSDLPAERNPARRHRYRCTRPRPAASSARATVSSASANPTVRASPAREPAPRRSAAGTASNPTAATRPAGPAPGCSAS